MMRQNIPGLWSKNQSLLLRCIQCGANMLGFGGFFGNFLKVHGENLAWHFKIDGLPLEVCDDLGTVKAYG